MVKGALIRWNDDKGFGFVRLEDEAKDVFIHISELKNMSRRPVVGDVLQFIVDIDDAGRAKAINASIEGVPSLYLQDEKQAFVYREGQRVLPRQRRIERPVSRRHNKRPRTSKFSVAGVIPILVCIVVVALSGGAVNRTYLATLPVEQTSVPTQVNNHGEYHCENKTMCTEMNSCEEATFYINNCPGTKMDGDGDGIPCESQWCN